MQLRRDLWYCCRRSLHVLQLYVSHGCTPGQFMSCSEASLFFTMITIPRFSFQVTGTRR
jgi:hypothetical protein